MNLYSFIKHVWKRIRRRHTLGKIFHVQSMQEVPTKLGSLVYIVGHPKPKWVIFSCPCGCGERLDVNLMQSRRPYWMMKIEKNTITIHPSLWVDSRKCGSHFWVRKSHLLWIDQDAEP